MDSISRDLSDNVDLLELGEAEDDHEVIGEAEAALINLSQRVEKARIQENGSRVRVLLHRFLENLWQRFSLTNQRFLSAFRQIFVLFASTAQRGSRRSPVTTASFWKPLNREQSP